MKKFAVIVGAITLLLIVGRAFLFSNSQDSSFQLPTSYEYFWGDGCPHCANVEEFFDAWEKKDQININKLEVWSSAANANLMRQRAKYCSLDTSKLGVPFLFTPEGKCLTGDTEIIDFFKSL